MSAKSDFIEFVKDLTEKIDINDWPGRSREYWETLTIEKEKPEFTDNGKLILKYLQETASDKPQQKAKDIADGLFITSRRVSGAVRKLVTDGYVEKVSKDPVVYALTEKGKNKIIED
jgi:DNA-binding MarR family transcriptional regulator